MWYRSSGVAIMSKNPVLGGYIKLFNPIGEFYIDDKKIESNDSYYASGWRKLLNTDVNNIKTQDKLNLFFTKIFLPFIFLNIIIHIYYIIRFLFYTSLNYF